MARLTFRLTFKLRIAILCLVVLFALYSSLRIINKESDRLRFHPEERTEEEIKDQSLSKLGGLLPRNAVVGYVSDLGSSTHSYDLFLAEYALCPLILVRAAKAPFVIADCGRSADGICFFDDDYALFKTFDHGLKLYEQKQK